MNIYNGNIDKNKHFFNLRKIKWAEMKCILEWKKYRFLPKRDKPKYIW